MVLEFAFPDVGEGITEGELRKWLVKVGDVVKQDQPLADVETDKAVVQIPAPQAGTILKLHFNEGDTMHVGAVMVSIGEKGEKAAPEARKTTSVVGDLEESKEVLQAPEPEAVVPVQPGVFHALPSVRKLAKEKKVDLSQLTGTGPGGRITEEDVTKAGGGKPRAAPASAMIHMRKYDFYGYIDHLPFKGVRKLTAKRMVQSLYTATHVTTMDEVDVTRLVELRERWKIKLSKEKIHLTYMPFIVKAVVHALKKHPVLNAQLDEEHDDIILKKYYNIGMAVDIPDGLLVPVIKGADEKSIRDLAKEIQELAQKAKDRKLDPGDMKGGTFTITNVGVIGGIFATPVINFPEVAIIAIGRIHERPVVEDGKIVIREILPLSLTFDHRVVDGAEASRFLETIKDHLNDPALFAIDRD
ncbi:MAG: 2-oxo acid dehydrogenase subunit E2 [Nanoarchaeota archaeon]|nr:2-oxo acid dehydrogenase subunit E2 [Nanoarchaeota archaeon]